MPGYRFRDFDKRAAQVMNPQDVRLAAVRGERELRQSLQNLKSPDELEEEDREAQAAVRHGCQGFFPAAELFAYRNCKSLSEEEHRRISQRHRN